MSSIIKEMDASPSFQRFIREIELSADYFVASANNIKNTDRLYALKLIIAYAFKEGVLVQWCSMISAGSSVTPGLREQFEKELKTILQNHDIL